MLTLSGDIKFLKIKKARSMKAPRLGLEKFLFLFLDT
jgi:hypothetical protein